MECPVRVENLTKTYKLYPSPKARALDAFRRTSSAQGFTALKDVTADFPEGEVVAILGKNGSGKSTLLKLITGIATPTSGTVETHGRISALLELTAGFDQELSGIDNIYLRALAMGIPRDEIQSRQDEIVRFADIGEFIHQPVRTYSSGMRARLGFAVSANIDPDVLILDEVLAVGDDVFRIKCIERMEEFRQQGKTILFVSHSLFTVKAFCTLGIWLNEGEVMASGEIGEVVMAYDEFLRKEKARHYEARLEQQGKSSEPQDRSDIIEVKSFRMLNDAESPTNVFAFGENVNFEFTYEVKRPIERLTFCYTVRDSERREVYMADKRNEDNTISSEVGEHTVRVKLKNLQLLGGEYLLSGEIWNNDAGLYVGYSNKRPFHIEQREFLGTGITHIDYEFTND